jgi:hypothetical protein
MKPMAMRHLRILCLLLTACALILSCSKKSEDGDATPDLGLSLKNTVWAGEFQYTAGDYTGLQPFSIELKEDKTLTWSDFGSTRPGGTWLTKKDTIVITFPNGTFFSAKVAGDNWSHFSIGAGAGIAIGQVSRSARADAATLQNTNWTGSLDGSALSIQFKAGSKLDYKLGSGSVLSATYTVEGAGIRFDLPTFLYPNNQFAVCLNNGTLIRGLMRSYSGLPAKPFYYTWIINKQ